MATTNVAATPASPPEATAPTVRAVSTAEQRARNQSALDHFDDRLKPAAAMTPAEIAEAEAPARSPEPDVSAFRPWQEPEWLVAGNAEVARLAAMTAEERQAEWDALPQAERDAYDAAFDQVMQSIDERQRRSRGLA
jgi:hypothetical protein